MAARRMIIVLVALLAISIVAAAIAPDRRSELLRGGEETTEPDTNADPAEMPAPELDGEALTRTIVASPTGPETVRAAPGDQLSLNVEVRETTEVQIEPLGLIETASPDDPALFELLLREPGALPVTTGADGELVGRIVVEEAEPAGKREDGQRGERPRRR